MLESELHFELIHDPNPELQESLWKRLHESSIEKLSPSDPKTTQSLAICVTRNQELRAGLLAICYFGGMNLQCLWVHQEERGQGLGEQLLARIETISRELRCNIIWGHTFGFQARDFYLKNGYLEFATLPDYPPGHGCSFLKKDLDFWE